MRFLPLFAMVIVAWLLIIAEVYLFFDVIVAYEPPLHQVGSLTALGLLKVASTLGLGALWFVVMSALAQAYTASKVRPRPPKPSP